MLNSGRGYWGWIDEPPSHRARESDSSNHTRCKEEQGEYKNAEWPDIHVREAPFSHTWLGPVAVAFGLTAFMHQVITMASEDDR